MLHMIYGTFNLSSPFQLPNWHHDAVGTDHFNL